MAQVGARYKILWLLLLVVSACTNNTDNNSTEVKPETMKSIVVPVFNADSSFAYVAQQVKFGPRVPNTKAHIVCGDWMIRKLKEYCDTVIVQPFQVRSFDGKILNGRNIIGSNNASAGNRIFLSSHWDTRPFADQDSVRKNEPIDGANDGASGVGVILEVARQMKLDHSRIAVDFIFFDVEDYGQPEGSSYPLMEDSYCLGAQYWSSNMHVNNYSARFGILLDMVGSTQSTHTQEGTSRQYAPEVVDLVWKCAREVGYSESFLFEATRPIIDDHYYVNRNAHIKCIDIIHYERTSPSNFWTHWHTHGDTIDKIDPKSLKAVGQTLLQVLYSEASL